MLSVVVLTHNRKNLLGKCLRSLLEQDCSPSDYEVMVADDGSNDGTEQMVNNLSARHPNLRYSWQKNRGVAAARNLGLESTRGDPVSFVADDYEVATDYVTTVIRLFKEHPEIMVVRFKVVAADEDFNSRLSAFYYEMGTVKRVATAENRRGFGPLLRALAEYREQATTRHGLEPAGAAAFRKEVFKIVGPFDEALIRSEDADMGRRLRQNNLSIYYYPFHHIRHHYERFPREALTKAFWTGFNRFRYYHKYQFSMEDAFGGWGRVMLEKIFTILGILVFCLRRGQFGKLLFYSPFLLMLEAANKMGFVTAMLQRSSRGSL